MDCLSTQFQLQPPGCGGFFQTSMTCTVDEGEQQNSTAQFAYHTYTYHKEGTVWQSEKMQWGHESANVMLVYFSADSGIGQ